MQPAPKASLWEASHRIGEAGAGPVKIIKADEQGIFERRLFDEPPRGPQSQNLSSGERERRSVNFDL